MQNKFGLKDFVLLVLVLAVGVSVWVSMVQDDRHWGDLQRMELKLEGLERTVGQIRTVVDGDLKADTASLERQLGQVRSMLEAGVVTRGAAAGADAAAQAQPGSSEAPASPTLARSTGRDESWAREGVPVSWQEPWTFASDPTDEPDYAPGGTFTELFPAQPAKITPFLYQDTYGRWVLEHVLESLGNYDAETLKMRGVLADAWQYDPEGRWLRVRINPRARFSDGTPVTAEDVRWTFHEFVMNPQLETERPRSVYNVITKIEPLADNVVEFTFAEPMFSNFEAALGMPILPRHFYEQFNPAQINQATGLLLGSGPYKLRALNPDNQWAPPQEIVLVRNEQYWGQKPAMDVLRYKTVNEDLARLTAYRNGEGDMITPSSTQFAQVTKEPGWDEKTHSLNWVNMQSGYSFIGWNAGPRDGGNLTPFRDKRVRKAMTMLLDREKMIRDIFEGIGQVATQPSNPTSPAFNAEIEPWPYDPDRAKELLAEAGWADRDGDGILENERGDEFTWEFTYPNGSEATERLANYMQNQMALAGIRMTTRPVDWSIYTDILNRRDFDAITMAWSASAPESDPNQIWHSKSIENQGDNFIQWSNPEADRLIEAGRRELNDEKRMELWHQLWQVLHEEQPYTFLRVSPSLRFIDKSFKNVHDHPRGLDRTEFYLPSAAQPSGW